MDNYSISLDLTKLRNVGITEIKGRTGMKECVVIPLEDNPEIFRGKKGCYLSMAVFLRKTADQFGNTHLLKASYPKEVLDKMTREEKYAIPILGNMKPMGGGPVQTEDYGYESAASDDEDLPF